MGEIDILLEDDRWSEIGAIEDKVRIAARAALKDFANPGKIITEVSVLLADDATLRRLNREFRGQDKPTNVLSFPSGSPLPIRAETQHIGDIALAFETCTREARQEDKTPADHLMHLVVHGVLHLLGYDHETDDDAERMESREVAILATLGIANPYLETQTMLGTSEDVRP